MVFTVCPVAGHSVQTVYNDTNDLKAAISKGMLPTYTQIMISRDAVILTFMADSVLFTQIVCFL